MEKLLENLKQKRKALNVAQRELKEAHAAIAELKARYVGINKGHNYYLTKTFCGMPVGTRLEVVGFEQRRKDRSGEDRDNFIPYIKFRILGAFPSLPLEQFLDIIEGKDAHT